MSYRLSDPAYTGFAITPSDTEDLPQVAKTVYVGGTGDVTFDTQDGVTLTFYGMQVGSYLLCGVKRVRATGTTATNLVGLV